jgi:hypothetical protein
MAAFLHPRDIRARAFEITGKLPGKNWHRKYIKRHDKTLKAPKPRHLVPKRLGAQNSNRTNVDGYYFRLRAQVERKRTAVVASSSESSIEPLTPALPVFRLNNDAVVPNLSSHHTSDFSYLHSVPQCSLDIPLAIPHPLTR